MREKYVLEYSSAVVDEPVIYTLVKRFDIKINILRAEISSGQEGSMLVELEAEPERLAEGRDYLAGLSITLSPIARSLTIREEACVHCGSCTGVCFSGCLTMQGEKWELVVDRDKCIACALCIKACPFGLISLKFGE
ncbi:MAG: NIL domain-containing protein [Rectinemataceae bacterium]|jgi:ferredoxin